ADKLDDAFADPRIEPIVELLKSVREDSSDAKAASDLLATIEEGRKRAAAAAAAKPTAAQRAQVAEDTWTAMTAAAPDAGEQHAAPQIGEDAKGFLAAHAGCVEADRPF